MSEFFKAATKCDVAMAKKAPMYIDQTGVMEELYRHERLLEQTLKTKLFLDSLEAQDAQERYVATSRDVEDILGCGVTVDQGLYKEPPMSVTALSVPPSERNLGSRAQERGIESKLNLWRRQLDERAAAIKETEAAENRCAKQEEESRRKDAERELNALITQRQLAAHEAEKERQKAAVEALMSTNRVHPIDVLQKRIQAELLDEMHEGTRLVAAQIETEEKGVDEVRKIEELREIKYKYHAPLKHIPTPW